MDSDQYAKEARAWTIIGGAQQAQPNPPPFKDPTLGEHIQATIRAHQDSIKQLELQYLEARQLGLLHMKMSKLREFNGW